MSEASSEWQGSDDGQTWITCDPLTADKCSHRYHRLFVHSAWWTSKVALLSTARAPQPPADAATVQASPETREWVAKMTAKWPAKPADAGTRCVLRSHSAEDGYSQCVRLDGHTGNHRFEPAAPPVSGDGDEAVVREIADRWSMATQEIPVPGYRMKQGVVNKMIGIGMEGCAKEAFTAGLERGRALGAREEREALLRLDQPWSLPEVLRRLSDATEHLLSDHGCDTHGHEGIRYAQQAADEMLAALAARRSGGQG